MNLVYFVNRGALGTVLTQGAQTRQLETLETRSLAIQPSGLADQQVALVWSYESRYDMLPNLIVVNDGMARDFLAWTNTFLPQFKPITSHLRVLERRELLLYDDDDSPIRGHTIPDGIVLRQAGIGLMLGELLSSGFLARPFRQSPLPINVLASGIAFPILRALWLRAHIDIGVIAERWSHLRQITKQQERPLLPQRTVGALRVLSELVGQGRTQSTEESQIYDVCRELAEGHKGSERLFAAFPGIKEANLKLDDTREARVSKFEAAVQWMLSRSTTHAELDAFAIGFLANELHPGTLTYVDLIYPLLQRWPSALIWYGVCAGLVERSNVLYELGGVGLRAWREVSRPDSIVSRPAADLSLLELDVLLSSDRPSEEFATSSGSSLSVELAPAIWSVVSWATARQRRAEMVPADARAGREEWRTQIDEQINALLTRAADLVGQLSGRSPRGTGSKQEESRTGSGQEELSWGAPSSKRRRPRR
jgi:hypothetical protein